MDELQWGGIEEIKTYLEEYNVIPIRLKEDVLHLDCVFGIVDETYAVIYQKGIYEEDYKLLSTFFQFININQREYEGLATNFLKINAKTIISDKANSRINKIISKLGYSVKEIKFSEFSKLGGNIRCCTLENQKMLFFHKNYLSVLDNKLYFKNLNLMELVKKIGCPLKADYPNLVRENIIKLKNCFRNSISKFAYTGEYIYANANKANYYSEILITANKNSDMIETSSYADLKIVERIIKNKIVERNKIILCNGVKEKEYIDLIISLINKNFRIVNVIDNLDEYRYFCSHIKKNVTIGLRINCKNLYRKNIEEYNADRFGLGDKDLKEIIKSTNDNIKIQFLHFHQRASEYDEEKMKQNITHIFNNYYVKLLNDLPFLDTINIGGGVPYDKINEYDYQRYTDVVIKLFKELSVQNRVNCPNIIQENGRYTVSDSSFNIYKVENVKEVDGKMWYIINDSIITTLPNSWALKEDFLFVPLNHLDNEFVEVAIAGNTCDCDDVYYYQNKTKLKMPKILKADKEPLYIGVFGMGAYQEILSGIGGIHHCLNREENDVIIYDKNLKQAIYKVRARQTIEDIFKRLKYDTKTFKKFK